MMDVDLSEVYELVANLTASGPKTRGLIVAVHTKTVFDVERTMKALAPVDTGALRASISHQQTSGGQTLSTEIGPTVEYARYLEEGTSRMAPQPYMRPAIDAHEGAYIAALAEAVNNGLR